MLERDIERKYVKWVKDQGGLAIKFTPRGDIGWPDRIVILNGVQMWVEIKASGKCPRPMQYRRLEQLAALGVPCFWADNFAGLIEQTQLIASGHTQ